MLDKFKTTLSISYFNDEVRHLLLFQILNLLLFAVATVMSVVNVVTEENTLFWETAIYAVLCLKNLVLSRKTYIAKPCFFIETILLMSVFIVTGIPGGFSILWILIVPAAAMSVFGMKVGGLFSFAVFIGVIFFFWLPFGRNLLQYDYSDIYMLRFPFIYISTCLISFYVEWIRQKTKEALIKSEERSRWLYRHDALTGVYNRHAFYEELGSIINASDRLVGTIMLDIDNFKRINDTYGHNVGDKALCHLTNIIEENTCEHCLTCRWGGEEFLIVMGCEHDPMQTAEAIRHNVEQNQMILENGEILTFTVSVGVSLCEPKDRETFIERINCADKALYDAKKTGKNRVVLG